MTSRFVVHRHKTGRSHFDLRFVEADILRCWSLLKEPPSRDGEKRLAIERESFAAQDMNRTTFTEEAFGTGTVVTWDEGEVDISATSSRNLHLSFRGAKLSGKYELRRMRWYPGNRWLLHKTGGL
jgi:DNA ligase D-like protein (predicted 3'-phosphoesterase)